jgi:hypothetical protein
MISSPIFWVLLSRDLILLGVVRLFGIDGLERFLTGLLL